MINDEITVVRKFTSERASKKYSGTDVAELIGAQLREAGLDVSWRCTRLAMDWWCASCNGPDGFVQAVRSNPDEASRALLGELLIAAGEP